MGSNKMNDSTELNFDDLDGVAGGYIVCAKPSENGRPGKYAVVNSYTGEIVGFRQYKFQAEETADHYGSDFTKFVITEQEYELKFGIKLGERWAEREE